MKILKLKIRFDKNDSDKLCFYRIFSTIIDIKKVFKNTSSYLKSNFFDRNKLKFLVSVAFTLFFPTFLLFALTQSGQNS
jgi:hypothetical protein